jgi:hypothetical protein
LEKYKLITVTHDLNTRSDRSEDFLTRKLNEYEQLFGQGKEHFNLEAIERRWAWFKRLLKKMIHSLKRFFRYIGVFSFGYV